MWLRRVRRGYIFILTLTTTTTPASNPALHPFITHSPFLSDLDPFLPLSSLTHSSLITPSYTHTPFLTNIPSHTNPPYLDTPLLSLQISSTAQLNQLIEELQQVENALSTERKKAQQDAEASRLQGNPPNPLALFYHLHTPANICTPLLIYTYPSPSFPSHPFSLILSHFLLVMELESMLDPHPHPPLCSFLKYTYPSFPLLSSPFTMPPFHYISY